MTAAVPGDYMLARYYGSSLGRFQSPDPGADTVLEDPQSWNKYAYVRNNPMSRRDPDGRKAQVTGSTPKERKAEFKRLKKNLKENGAKWSERRKLKLNKDTGEMTLRGGSSSGGSLAFESLSNVIRDDNRATFHFVDPGENELSVDGKSSATYLTILNRGEGGVTTGDITGDQNPAGGVDVEIWIAGGGNPTPTYATSDPENLVTGHETREAYEFMSNPAAAQPMAHQVATSFENQLRSSLGFALRAP